MTREEELGSSLFGGNLFEAATDYGRMQHEEREVWIVEKTTPAGRKIQYRVNGKKQAADYAASIGGILIGKEEKKNGSQKTV